MSRGDAPVTSGLHGGVLRCVEVRGSLYTSDWGLALLKLKKTARRSSELTGSQDSQSVKGWG